MSGLSSILCLFCNKFNEHSCKILYVHSMYINLKDEQGVSKFLFVTFKIFDIVHHRIEKGFLLGYHAQ